MCIRDSHIILDGLGCLWRYLDLRKSNPDIVLLLNRTPRPGVAKYPPFVTELLELFDINWEYTDPGAQYETVYFGDTLNQDETGGRVAPDPKLFPAGFTVTVLTPSPTTN